MAERGRINLRQRLRRLGTRRSTRPTPQPTPSPARAVQEHPPLTHVIGGDEISTSRGTFHLREITYDPHHIHGRYPLGRILDAPLHPLRYLSTRALSVLPPVTEMAFLDTETLGLSRGTGTTVFLVGLGFITPTKIYVHQYFIRDLHEEAAMLEHLATALARATMVVTYNGRSFDLPLLNTRYTLHLIPSPLEKLGHVDLLVQARRLWGHRLPRCTLGDVERGILGHHREELDIPGWLVPVLYRDYLRTRDPTPLRQVFYHNLHDILSLIALTDIVLRAWDDPWSEPSVYPEDLVSLAMYFMTHGEEERAEVLLRYAMHHVHHPQRRLDVYRTLGRLLKRREQWAEALSLWETWTQELPLPDLTPFEELAKYYEWRARDFRQALHWTDAGLAILDHAPQDVQHRWRPTLEHRRRRLVRRLRS